MKKRIIYVISMALASLMALVGCANVTTGAPSPTAMPTAVTYSPEKRTISEEEARKEVESVAYYYALWGVQDAGYKKKNIVRFKVTSIECTGNSDTRWHYTVYGTFAIEDNYGRVTGRYTFDHKIEVDKDDGETHTDFMAKVREQ